MLGLSWNFSWGSIYTFPRNGSKWCTLVIGAELSTRDHEEIFLVDIHYRMTKWLNSKHSHTRRRKLIIITWLLTDTFQFLCEKCSLILLEVYPRIFTKTKTSPEITKEEDLETWIPDCKIPCFLLQKIDPHVLVNYNTAQLFSSILFFQCFVQL